MTVLPKRIEGLVAAILNARELVINVGESHGVFMGMKFAVLSPTPLDIVDPLTNKVLDRLDREKVRVQATEVRPNVTICRTYRVKPGSFEDTTMSIVRAWSAGQGVETFRVSDDSTPPPLTEEESYVKVNDRVVSVSEK